MGKCSVSLNISVIFSNSIFSAVPTGKSNFFFRKNISKKNLKHINKHLAEFQKYDSSLNLEDLIMLGENIFQNSENLISIPSDRKVFEKNVKIGTKTVIVRVILNCFGILRSVHIRY